MNITKKDKTNGAITKHNISSPTTRNGKQFL